HLLIAPASLLANWQAEIERFAPALTTLLAHPSGMPARELADLASADLRGTDLVMTTYGTLARAEALRARDWSLVVLDEAQAIKNPGARQTQAVKALKAHARIALTGTPVENRLGDLWSIYDFLDPGLLGSAREFSAFVKRLASSPEESYAPLRRLIQPYMLRRLKADPEIVEPVAGKHEKMLVFTQFREATEPLAGFLGDLFGRPGVVLHGSTPVRARGGLVRRFQEDPSVPFFVLSVKAGGSGLNLMAASHVVHFDRWWNPAVEDQ